MTQIVCAAQAERHREHRRQGETKAAMGPDSSTVASATHTAHPAVIILTAEGHT